LPIPLPSAIPCPPCWLQTCQAAAFQYAAVIPAFRPTQCGRYELVSSVTVTPVIEVAGVTSRPAVKQVRAVVTAVPGPPAGAAGM